VGGSQFTSLGTFFRHILLTTIAANANKEIIQTAHSVDGMKSGATLNAEWKSAALRIVADDPKQVQVDAEK
jgi:hypothetical protein